MLNVCSVELRGDISAPLATATSSPGLPLLQNVENVGCSQEEHFLSNKPHGLFFISNQSRHRYSLSLGQKNPKLRPGPSTPGNKSKNDLGGLDWFLSLVILVMHITFPSDAYHFCKMMNKEGSRIIHSFYHIIIIMMHIIFLAK